jgi:hypothetical protein
MNLAQSDSVQIKRRDSFSGHYSTLIRKNNNNNFKQLFLQNDSISETEKMEVFPYTLTFKQEFARSGYITKLEDKTYWIKTDSLIPNVLFLEDESKEEMGNYTILPFIKHDKFSIYLESDQAFLLAEKITDLGLNNSVGSIKVEATQVKPTTLKISYEVKLNKRTLSSTLENNLYKELMIEWNNLVQKKWLISMP